MAQRVFRDPSGSHVLRSPSFSSDIMSTSAKSSMNIAVPDANPPPAYIAQQAASDLISAESDQTIAVSQPALRLVNEFLDQVLYNILCASRSLSLGALKAAVPNVLKPRLGKAALRVADEELKEYLEDDEEAEMNMRRGSVASIYDFDADTAWRLARLRCMVYTRLGDLEEEDEEEWLEKEGLLDHANSMNKATQRELETGPASAIFLTSVIEYLGEQALYYAAQHTQRRHQLARNQTIPGVEGTSLTPNSDALIVEGKDMNHVGRDSPLSRLWRSWRRITRETSDQAASPEVTPSFGPTSPTHSRNGSSALAISRIAEERASQLIPLPPSQVALPMSVNDVDEIEVPGLAPAISDDEDEHTPDLPERSARRPVSLHIFPLPDDFPGRFDLSDEASHPPLHPPRAVWTRKRSSSSPIPKATLRSEPSKVKDTTVPSEDNVTMPGAYVSDDDASSERDPKIPDDRQKSRDGVTTAVGGTMTAIAGAFGVGALTSSAKNRDTDRTEVRRGVSVDGEAQPPAQRKTVAEEMLGSGPAVAPPRDAATGASITNVSDFYSMHVPAVTPALTPEPVVTPEPRYYSSLHPDGSDYSLPSVPPIVDPSRRRTDSPISLISDSRPQTARSALSSSNYVPAASVLVPGRENLDQNQYVSSNNGRLVSTTHESQNRTTVVPLQKTESATSEYARAGYSPPPNIHREVTTSGKDLRPVTAGSSTSRKLNMRPQKPGNDVDEAKKKSLEILIRSDETLHYTLTPAAAMREEESAAARNRSTTQDMADFLRNTGPPVSEHPRNHVSPLNAHPTTPATAGLTVNTLAKPRDGSLIQNMPSPTTPRRKNPVGEPRDARTETNAGIRDLADYMRSTGPTDDSQLPKPLSPRPPTAASQASTTVPPQPDNDTRQTAVTPPNKPTNRLKYQARDARAPRHAESSDLIDFLREGPPGAAAEQRVPREHRIDRRVAPFRTTLDSEDLNAIAPRQDLDSSARYSETSTQEQASIAQSISSQSPLVGVHGKSTNGATHELGSGAVPARSVKPLDDGMPQKTRSRVKDPYAIDYSDDDMDDDDIAGPGGNEESLIDFLRNTAPPNVKNSASPVGMNRDGAIGQISTEHYREGAARPSSPHLTQVGTKRDSYKPTQPTHAAHMDRSRIVKPRFEPRDAKPVRVSTSELAEYLRNSGPPPAAENEPQPIRLPQNINVQPPTKQEPKEGMFKKFSKRKSTR